MLSKLGPPASTGMRSIQAIRSSPSQSGPSTQAKRIKVVSAVFSRIRDFSEGR